MIHFERRGDNRSNRYALVRNVCLHARYRRFTPESSAQIALKDYEFGAGFRRGRGGTVSDQANDPAKRSVMCLIGRAMRGHIFSCDRRPRMPISLRDLTHRRSPWSATKMTPGPQSTKRVQSPPV
jgi:hypothetical protein